MRRLDTLTEERGYLLVTVDTDVQGVKDYLGEKAEGYDYFVTKEKDGEWVEVWGNTSMTMRDNDLMERVV